MSVIPTTQTPISSQDTIKLAQIQGMAIHIAISALVQNELDHILRLRKPHLPRFADWKHEDHRKHRLKSRKSRKKSLLQQHPGLLSGPQAMDLQGDDWTPMYIISASIPPAQLKDTAHGTDLQVCNVIWQYKTSTAGPLALTLYTNHVDPTPSVQCTSTGHSSSHNLSRLLVGQKGVHFVHASHYLMEALRKEPTPTASNESDTVKAFGIGLRVGHTVGECFWQGGSEAGLPDRLILKEEDLTPYSLKSLEVRPEFTFPYDTHANRILGAEKKTRVQAIYWRRFQYKMSEKEGGETAVTVTEPAQERAFAKADEEVVTICGLSGTLAPEYLFSGIYTVFPPKREWSISFLPCASPVLSFFMPDSEDSTRPRRDSAAVDTIQVQLPSLAGQLYFRDRLVATSPAGFSRVGINYFGGLDTSESGFDVQVTGVSFKEFRRHLFRAVDMAIRTLPELAVELAVDMLTEASALPDDCGPTPSSVGDDAQSTEAKGAYRAAFEAAWRRLDPKLADHQGGVYPYVTSLGTVEDKALIQDLGMHPVPVHPRVRLLLAKCGVYPLIKDYAESLLLSAVGAAHHPAGVDILKAALQKLLPDADLAADPLSIRLYACSYPRVVWDADSRVFVMASSLGARCAMHKDATDFQPEAGDPQAGEKQPKCLCWIGVALQAAASSWRAKNGSCSRPGFDEEFFHVLLDCYQTALPALRTMGLASLPEGGGEQESTIREEEEEDVLSYFGDAPAQSEDTTSQMGPRPSDSAAVATPTPPSASGGRTVPYPSPASSPPLPRRRLFIDLAQQQPSVLQSNIATPGSGAQNTLEHREPEKVPKDMAGLIRIWEKAAQGMVGIAQASKHHITEWQKESAAMREELAAEQACRAALDAAFAAYKVESEAALAANAEAMQQKDAQINQLEESVHTLTARVQEQAAIVERQTALSQDQTERIQELREREIRWTAHMEEMLAEVREPPSPRMRADAHGDGDAEGPRKRLKLS
ncbi:hypothetical protein LXA43DRAFT_1146300 [Ganoderma leucocontextum]|nr:hypothetical protein LXA43DRAFT_1146300 [Ganoderma leucocontextum]